jgi:hypothetical protein
VGLDLTFSAGDSSHEIRLQAVDSDILQVLSERNPDDVEALIGVDDFGEPRSISRARVLRALEALLERLDRDADSLPFVYKYKFEEGPLKDDRPGTGMAGSFHINGESRYFYSIDSGLGFCQLLKSEIGPDGRGHDVERIDVRSRTSILTDNMGEIRIYKSKKKSGLERHLRELRAFLQKLEVDTLTKILC